MCVRGCEGGPTNAYSTAKGFLRLQDAAEDAGIMPFNSAKSICTTLKSFIQTNLIFIY